MRMPARKAGTATPIWETAESMNPDGLRCRTAMIVPMGIARMHAITIPVPTSHKVTRRRSASCGPIAVWEM